MPPAEDLAQQADGRRMPPRRARRPSRGDVAGAPLGASPPLLQGDDEQDDEENDDDRRRRDDDGRGAAGELLVDLPRL
jgi:hypothetical protein